MLMFIHELYSPYPMLLCHPVYAMAFLHVHPRHVPNNSGCSHAPMTSCTMLDDAEFTKHRRLQSITFCQHTSVGHDFPLHCAAYVTAHISCTPLRISTTRNYAHTALRIMGQAMLNWLCWHHKACSPAYPPPKSLVTWLYTPLTT